MHVLAIAGNSEDVKSGGGGRHGSQQLIPDLQNMNSYIKRLVERGVLGGVVYRGNLGSLGQHIDRRSNIK